MGVKLYPDILYQGEVTADSCGNEVDGICQSIYDACKGSGTDAARLIGVMGTLTPEQRCKVFPRYKKVFAKNLVHEMKDECGGKPFGAALQILAHDPLSADCHLIAKACEGTGANLFLVLSVLCGRTNEELEMIKKKWSEWKSEDITGLLDREFSGGVEKLIMQVLQATEETQDASVHTRERMEADSKGLHDAGLVKSGTNQEAIFKILCAAPSQYLKELNMVFAEMYGFTVEKALEKELSGSARDAALFLVGMKVNPYEAVAKLIDKACKGFGTDNLLLSSILIRYHSVLKQVNTAHQELFKQSIRDRVVSEASKDYETLLLAVVDTAVGS